MRWLCTSFEAEHGLVYSSGLGGFELPFENSPDFVFEEVGRLGDRVLQSLLAQTVDEDLAVTLAANAAHELVECIRRASGLECRQSRREKLCTQLFARRHAKLSCDRWFEEHEASYQFRLFECH